VDEVMMNEIAAVRRPLMIDWILTGLS
jgi:hypothetical protein